MEPTTQVNPILLLLGAMALLVLGLLTGRKISGRWRWFGLVACGVPMIILLVVAWHTWQGMREDQRRSADIFSRLGVGPDLVTSEREAYRLLAEASPQVRAGVMRLAFANATNAGLALPRIEFLLQSALQLDPNGKGRHHLWNDIVQPALRDQPPREVVLLGAATAASCGYSSNQVTRILEVLSPMLARETNAEMRALALGVFVPLVDFATMAQIETAANLLLPELLEEPNPMLANMKIGRLEPAGSRRVRDLCRLAARLSGEPARRFADRLIPMLYDQTNALCALALGKVLVECKAELKPSQVDRALTNLVRQLPRNRGGVLQERTTPLTGLAEVMTPDQAASTISLLVAILQQDSDQWYLAEMSRPFVPLAQRLSDEDVLRLADPMIAVFPGVLKLIADRLPQEQAYVLTDRLMQRAIDTPNPTRRSAQIPPIKPLAARLTAERAGKLADEIWQAMLQDEDGSRRSDEANCLIMVLPQLDDAPAVSIAKRVVEQMQQPRLGLPMLVRMLTPLLPHCDPATVQEAVAWVMKSYDKSAMGLGSNGLEQRDFLLGASLTTEQMKRVLEPLVAALEHDEDHASYLGTARCLAALADQLSPHQEERVANRLVFLATQRPDAYAMASLSLVASNLTLTPYQAKRIVDIILPSALQCRLPQSMWFAACLDPFTSRLAAEEAETQGRSIISAMGVKFGDMMCTTLDARCLLSLTNALGPEEARRLAEQLLQIPVQRGNKPGLQSLLDDSPGTIASADWKLPSMFIERQESARYKYRLEAWSRSLAALLERMKPAEAQTIAEPVAARCAAQGETGPIAFEEQTARVLHYASAPVLEDILRRPFTGGGLRLMVLRALELKTGKSFQGDKWRFAASMVATNSN